MLHLFVNTQHSGGHAVTGGAHAMVYEAARRRYPSFTADVNPLQCVGTHL